MCSQQREGAFGCKRELNKKATITRVRAEEAANCLLLRSSSNLEKGQASDVRCYAGQDLLGNMVAQNTADVVVAQLALCAH